MAESICIITPTGMKCISSPTKTHGPASQACADFADWTDLNAERKAVDWNAIRDRFSKDVDASTPGLSGRSDIIRKVVELMLAAPVGDRTPFTIVRVV